MHHRLVEVAETVKVWCMERNLNDSDVVLHFHPSKLRDIVLSIKQEERMWRKYFVSRGNDESPELSSCRGGVAQINGLTVADDGLFEEYITVTAGRNDHNYSYIRLYDTMPREFPWDKEEQESNEEDISFV